MVLLLPPAPAARVELGLWFAWAAARSCAARLRIADLGPPGGVGDDGRDEERAASEPEAATAGDAGRGDPDCWLNQC